MVWLSGLGLRLCRALRRGAVVPLADEEAEAQGHLPGGPGRDANLACRVRGSCALCCTLTPVATAASPRRGGLRLGTRRAGEAPRGSGQRGRQAWRSDSQAWGSQGLETGQTTSKAACRAVTAGHPPPLCPRALPPTVPSSETVASYGMHLRGRAARQSRPREENSM